MTWTGEPRPSTPDWSGDPRPEDTTREVEFRADFEQGGDSGGEGATTDRRPDTVSPDYRTAFAPGPRDVGDAASAGTAERAWLLVDDGGDVTLARANGAFGAADAWEAAEALFSYEGVAGCEWSLAFDQNGAVVAACERPTGTAGAAQVWLYRFDAGEGEYTFTAVATGRTPRLLLDDAYPGSAVSDVVLFYLTAAGLAYRQQREDYLTEDVRALAGVANLYLEKVERTPTGRVAVSLLGRNTVTGRYGAPTVYQSQPYPLRLPVESLTATGSPMGGRFAYLPAPVEEALVASALPFGGGSLRELQLSLTLEDVEALQTGTAVPLSGALRPILLQLTVETESAQATAVPTDGSLSRVVIQYTLYDVESLAASGVPTDGELETV